MQHKYHTNFILRKKEVFQPYATLPHLITQNVSKHITNYILNCTAHVTDKNNITEHFPYICIVYILIVSYLILENSKQFTQNQ